MMTTICSARRTSDHARRVALGGALIAWLALAPSSRADTVDPAVQAKADALFDQGQADYKAGQFPAAIELFKQAYDAVHDPVYLFNLAQAYRKVFDCEASYDYYTRYLTEAPAAENRAKVEQFLHELQPCVDARRKEHEQAKAGQAAEQARLAEEARKRHAATAVDTEIDHGATLRYAGIATGAAGAIGFLVGGIYAVKGQNIKNDIAANCTGPTCNWDAFKARDAEGKTANTIAAVGFVGGGLAVVTGAVLYVVGRTRIEHVSVAPTAGGAVVTARLSF